MMKGSAKIRLGLALIFSLWSFGAFAGDLVIPASSDDLNAFDQVVAQSRKKSPPPAPTPDRFGTVVSQEARKMKGAAPAGNKNFGQWVSGQRRQNGFDNSGGPGSGSDDGVGAGNPASNILKGHGSSISSSASGNGNGKGNPNKP